MKRCNKCLLPESVPCAGINADGVCGYCRDSIPSHLAQLLTRQKNAVRARRPRADGRPVRSGWMPACAGMAKSWVVRKNVAGLIIRIFPRLFSSFWHTANTSTPLPLGYFHAGAR